MRICLGLMLFFCSLGSRAQECTTTYGYLYVDVRCSEITTTGYTYNGITFSQGGSYTVTLVNAGGCDSVVTLDINVTYPGTSMTDTTVLACQLPFHWGCQDIYEAGTYGCSIMIGNPECGDSAAYLSVTVSPADTMITDTTICSSEVPFEWNGEEYSESGVFEYIRNPKTISCSVDILKLTVLPNPQSLTEVTICAGDLPYLWEDQEIFSAGIYTSHIATGSRCDSLAILDLHVAAKPSTNFGFSLDTLNGNKVHFKDSTQNGLFITQWGWDFNDGTLSSQKDPDHTFPDYGSYMVMHWVRSADGCYSDTVTKIVTTEQYVNHRCAASFTVANNPCGTPVSFTNTSTTTAYTGPIESEIWDYGDGKKDTLYSNFGSTTHTYTLSGNYTASLTIFTSNCTGTTSRQLVISTNPQAKFGFADTSGHCIQSNVALIDSATISNGSIQSYTWHFGDGSSSNQPSPVHKYATPGTYTVWQFVYSAAGCSDSSFRTYTVYPDPQVDFSFAVDNSDSKTINFVNLSSISSGTIDSLLWNFGDDSTSIQTNPSHSYLNYDTYAVTLEAISDQGCRSEIVKNIIVEPDASRTVFTFIGSGNWSSSTNWLDQVKPPNPLPSGYQIIIQGDCILNVSQTIESGASLVVTTGANLTVLGNLLNQ